VPVRPPNSAPGCEGKSCSSIVTFGRWKQLKQGICLGLYKERRTAMHAGAGIEGKGKTSLILRIFKIYIIINFKIYEIN
jgi:hypothetical protein